MKVALNRMLNLAFVLLLTIAVMNTAPVSASSSEITAELSVRGNIVYVSGTVPSGKADINISYSVYFNDYTEQDLLSSQSPLSVILTVGETKSGENGKFNISFPLKDLQVTNYTVRIYSEDAQSAAVFPISVSRDFFDYGFESDSELSEWSCAGIELSREAVDADHGTAAKLSGQSGSVSLSFDGFKSGKYLISFDIYGDEPSAVFSLRGRDSAESDTSLNMINLDYTNGISLCRNTPEASTDVISDVQGKWSRIDLFLDMDYSEAYLYIDSVYTGFMADTKPLFEITSLDFSVSKNDNLYIDNVLLKRVDYSEALSLIESGRALPESFSQKITCRLENAPTGGIYFGLGTIELSLGYIYREYGSIAPESHVSIEHEGQTVYDSVKAISPVPFEKSTDTFSFRPKRYGFYNLSVVLSGEDGLISEYNYEFSVMNVPTDGNKNEALGVQTHFTVPCGSVDKLMPILAKSGFGFIRDQCRWYDYEKSAGVYAFPEVNQKIYSALESHNMDMIQGVGGNTWIWSYRNKDGDWEYPPRSDEVLTHFADYAASMAGGLRGRVSYFEIWNEMDLGSSNPDGNTPADYANMLRWVYPAVKSANPEAKVLGFSSSENSYDWIKSTLDALDGEYPFDVLTTHPYQKVSPDADTKFRDRAASLRALLKSCGIEDKEIWADEFGYSTSLFSEEQQAVYTLKTLIMNSAYGCYDKMSYYLSTDRDKSGGMGLFRSAECGEKAYSAKPAALAVSNYNAVLGSAIAEEIVSDSADGSGSFVYKFKTDLNRIYALWNNGGSTVALPVDSEYAKIYDIYGNFTIVNSQNGFVSVDAAETPVFVEYGAMITETALSDEGQGSEQTCFRAFIDRSALLDGDENSKTAIIFSEKASDGGLIDCRVVSAKARDETIVTEYILDSPENLEIFVWDLNSLTPICNKIKISKAP